PASATSQTAQRRTLMPVPEGLRAQVMAAGRQVAGDLAGSHEAQGSGYLLKVVQPALLGLMDGSISTLAPLFASAFATRNPHTAFLAFVPPGHRGRDARVPRRGADR